jgi:hypothetical protein
MYSFVLALHNLVRWVVLILGVAALVGALSGWIGGRQWSQGSRRLGMFFTSAIDLQLLIGLALYFFLSPITTSALRNFGSAMGDPGTRFFALEHALYMVVAVVFAHLGSSLPKRVEDPSAKHRRASLWFGAAFVVILLGMPWMRPLLRGF